MPNERQELICASPNMTKGLHGLPDWLIKNSQANTLLLTIVLKYFTFQAVVWHLEGDNEAMSNYFHKVSKNITIYLGIFLCSLKTRVMTKYYEKHNIYLKKKKLI